MDDHWLVCLGVGLKTPADTTHWTRLMIERADVVFHVLSGQLQQEWLLRARPDARSLLHHYAMGKERSRTYSEMCSEVLDAAASQGLTVVLFYGSPGVDNTICQTLLKASGQRGISAYTMPGVSSLDWLIADLGFDPATHSCLVMDANLLSPRTPLSQETGVVLFQIGLAGVSTLPDASSSPDLLSVMHACQAVYGPSHQVVLYEASVHPLVSARIDAVPLEELHLQSVSLATTLFVPPIGFDIERNYMLSSVAHAHSFVS